MKDIKPILKSLGLLDSEIKTYMKALEKGPSTVLEFTKYTGLSRQATYVAIQSLTDRGLMSSAQSDKKSLYAAEDPEKLLAYAQRRESKLKENIDDLKRALPELKLRAGGEKPTVKVFEGKEGLITVIEELQKNPKKDAVEITDGKAMYSVLTLEDLLPLRKKLKKANVYIRGLYTGEKVSPKTVGGYRYVLPKEYWDFKTNIGVYGNKIAMVTFGGKIHSVIIENPHLAKTLKIVFDIAFKEAKKHYPEK